MTPDPLRVTATLCTTTVGLVRHPVQLDGPLAWAGAQLDPPDEPITQAHAPEIDLPLQKWWVGDSWGWCASKAHYDVEGYGAAEIRRKPATAQMARFTTEKKHHSGLGPHKARDTMISTEWVRSAWWHVLCTDEDRLHQLLDAITHLGKHAAIGHGRVASWTVEPDPAAMDGWRDRPMPSPAGRVQGVRPPYWHPTRKVLCA